MNKIKVCVRTNEHNKTRYYRDFKIIEELPKIGDSDFDFSSNSQTKITDITSATIDCEQGNEEIYHYDYYEISKEITRYAIFEDDIDEIDEDVEYVCIKNVRKFKNFAEADEPVEIMEELNNG